MATDQTPGSSTDEADSLVQESETDAVGVRLSLESQSLFQEVPKGPAGAGSNNFVPVEAAILPERLAHDPQRRTVAVLDDYRHDDMVVWRSPPHLTMQGVCWGWTLVRRMFFTAAIDRDGNASDYSARSSLTVDGRGDIDFKLYPVTDSDFTTGNAIQARWNKQLFECARVWWLVANNTDGSRGQSIAL